MSVAIYYRVSTDKQDFMSQKVAVEEYLKNNNIKDPIIYKDVGSGRKDDRPGYGKLMCDIDSGLIDTLIVYKLDRLSRRANSTMMSLIYLDELNIKFISVTQPILNMDSKLRTIVCSVLAVFTELERDHIVGRVKHGIQAAKNRGVKLGRPKKCSNEMLVKIKKLKNDGLTLKGICDKLKSDHKVDISPPTIYRMLKKAN